MPQLGVSSFDGVDHRYLSTFSNMVIESRLKHLSWSEYVWTSGVSSVDPPVNLVHHCMGLCSGERPRSCVTAALRLFPPSPKLCFCTRLLVIEHPQCRTIRNLLLTASATLFELTAFTARGGLIDQHQNDLPA
jgi:hypothetical protein